MELFLYQNEQQTGPYTEAEARALVAKGEVVRTCLTWQEGMPEWLPLEAVIDLPARPTPPPLPKGLPPLPPRPFPTIGPVASPQGSKKAAEPIDASKLQGAIIDYGLKAIGCTVMLLTALSKCHH